MNRSVQELKYSLQTLALPVTAQLRLHQEHDCRVAELAHAFRHWRQTAGKELKERLTAEQAQVLARLDGELLALSDCPEEPEWSDLALRRCVGWRRIRCLAREALIRFNWPLDLPPMAHD